MRFVAVKSDKDGWSAEAAIPLTELTGERVTVGKAWGCNVVRVVPGRGVQFPQPPIRMSFGWWSMFNDTEGNRFALGQAETE